MSRRSLLNELLKLHDGNESVKRGVDGYNRRIDDPEFKFFKDMLLTIKGSILSDMFSHDFTELPADEKDVMQRTYYNLNTMLDFLIAPNRFIQAKKSKLISHAERATIAKRQEEARTKERKEQ